MAGFAEVGRSWWQLLVAAALAVVLTQVALLAHDTCHRQVFTSHRRNEWTSRVLSGLIGGLSYGWWMSRHTHHHGGPTRRGATRTSPPGWWRSARPSRPANAGSPQRRSATRGGGFFPLLLLEGLNLHLASARAVLARRQPAPRHRWVDRIFLAVRLSGYPAVLFTVLPPPKAAAFLAVQLAVFGLALGGAFAPNHTGMAIVAATTRVDFARRQILMSRNVYGGVVIDFLMGGLNRQIEHHLFPSMPPPASAPRPAPRPRLLRPPRDRVHRSHPHRLLPGRRHLPQRSRCHRRRLLHLPAAHPVPPVSAATPNLGIPCPRGRISPTFVHDPPKERPMPVPADLSVLLDKKYEESTMTEVLAAPVSALQGVSNGDAQLLKQAFNIATVADLGNSKYFQAAHALVMLAELGAK